MHGPYLTRPQQLFNFSGSWPKKFDISRMVYGIPIRLAGMKALTQIALEPSSEYLEPIKFYGGACPQTPIGGVHLCALLFTPHLLPLAPVLEPPLKPCID